MENFVQPFIQYLLSPAIVAGVAVFIFSRALKLGEIKRDFEIIREDVGELKAKSGSIISNITVIKTHLVDKAGMNALLFRAMSPISLTPSGKRLIKKVEFDEFVLENYQEIEARFKQEDANTLLKLDDLSDKVVEEYFVAGDLSHYDDKAFKEGISTEVLLRACALYLREFMADKLGITD